MRVALFKLRVLWCFFMHRRHHYVSREYTFRTVSCRKCGQTFFG